jgi:hypothetical protein
LAGYIIYELGRRSPHRRPDVGQVVDTLLEFIDGRIKNDVVLPVQLLVLLQDMAERSG